MKLIVAILLLHLALVVVCFGVAVSDPGHNGLWPILVFFADFPASYLAEWLRRALHDAPGFASVGRLFTDAFSYVLVGSAWWLLLGLLGCVHNTSEAHRE